MTNPIKPVGPSAVPQAAPTEGPSAPAAASETQATTAPTRAFEVGPTQVAQTQGAAPAQGAGTVSQDPLQAAIREVVADIKAGIVPDAAAAADAVIIRLVNIRFSHLNEAGRRKMQLHIHELLHSDPQFHDRIERLLQAAPYL